MRRNFVFLPAGLVAAAIALAGCESTTNLVDKVQDSVADFNPFGTAKKPLPGERKPLFPEGIPGVQQGVPSELLAGSQAATTDDQAPAATATIPDRRTPRPAAPAETAPRPQPKKVATPKPQLRTTTRPEAERSEPREDAVWPPPPAQAATPAWPAAPPPAQPASSPWPSQTPPSPPPAWPTPR
jgi:hypothetical protein